MLAQFEWGGDGSGVDPRQLGLDLSIEFAPDWRRLGGRYYATPKARLAMAMGLIPKGYARHRVFDYGLMAQRALIPGFRRLSVLSTRISTGKRMTPWLPPLL